MSIVHEIKFFEKEGELFAALFDKPSILFPEFWIKNIKASELGLKKLPKNIKLQRKYKVHKLGIEPFEVNKDGLAFGISDFVNRVTQDLGKETPKNVINNRTININQGNYNEKIEGSYHQQTGNFGIGHMSGGEITGNAKVAGIINEAENQNLADAAQDIQQLLEQLSENYPTSTNKERMMVVGEAVDQIENNLTLKGKVIDILKFGETEALKEAVNHPLINILVATIEEWQDS
ncbi:MAG: hypothetical protein AAGA80_23145 [Cyanobacteria bacterium P01_F01_bin.143]